MTAAFIVDDHDLVRHGLVDIFRAESGFDVVGVENVEAEMAPRPPWTPD
jgi:DNA-binding NarL/FixJ family response regulator